MIWSKKDGPDIITNSATTKEDVVSQMNVGKVVIGNEDDTR